VGRERTLRFMAGVAERAGVDLSPGASWLLLRMTAPDALTFEEIAALPHVDAGRLGAVAAELDGAALLADGRPTAAGREMRERLVAARTDGLRELVADWKPDENPEVDGLVRQMAAELAAPA
jgi:hypothetical protein